MKMKAAMKNCIAHLSVIGALFALAGCEPEGLTGNLTAQDEGVTVDRPFAYIVRDFPAMGETSSVDSRPPLDPRAPYQVNPGARLYVRDRIALSSDEKDILSGYFGGGDYDVKDLTMSPDGERMAFAAHGPEGNVHHSTWNVYEYNFSTRKLRRFIEDDELANAGQDTSPAYTNDGRIVFSSDRQVSTGDYRVADAREYIEDFNEPASLLHIMKPDGSDLLQITFGAYHDIEPNSMLDGQIVFIRWGREYETLYDCTEENIDDPNFNTHPHGGGFGQNNGNGFPPGLDKPKDWTTGDKCGGSLAGETQQERIFIQDVLSLYRIAPSGGNMHRYFGSLNEAVSDASFIHYMDPIPLSDGNLITIMRHIYNPIYGGDVVKINSQNFYAVGKPIDEAVSGVAEESQTPGLVNFYPSQVSPTGWYSAVFPYRDGSGRLLASWAQCIVHSGDVSAVCEGSSITSDLQDPQYGIWAVDPAENTRLPVVKGHLNALYTDIVVGNYNENARPYEAPRAEFLLDDGFGAFHIRSVYDMDGQDMAEPEGGIVTLRDPSVTAPDDRSERFIRVVVKRNIPSELEQAILSHPELNPPDEPVKQLGLQPILGSGPRELYDILSYGTVEPDGSAMIQVPHDIHFTFEIVNKYGKRVDMIAEPDYHYGYLMQHPDPLLVEEGELRECNGCHDRENDIPHARTDIPMSSANPGAPSDLTPFPNANPQIIAPRYRDTMAEALSYKLGRVPTGTGDVVFEDYWTDPIITSVQPPFAYRYRDLTTPPPVNDPACVETWTSNCKVTINYLEHIQPIWDACRPHVDNRSCTSCHDKADNDHTDDCPNTSGSALPELTGDTAPWSGQKVNSYVQLFDPEYYQRNDSGDWVKVDETQLETQCPNGIEGDLSVEPLDGVCIAHRLMSARGAIPSAPFFSMFHDDPDDDAYEIVGIDAGTPKVDHRGMLTPAELRLIAEWLDAGAHYYNDTDKYELPPL
jgi:hypothetical protein